jgi:Asp-tRNA(Asn)/Glu-tRNA(Gln) amidotransferase C subunit
MRDISVQLRDPSPPKSASRTFEDAAPEDQKKIILLETLPLGDESLTDHPLCQLLERSAQNQQKILEQIEKLAAVLGNSGDFVTGCWEATTAARQAEVIRSDMDARFEFLQALKGNLTTTVEQLFQIPDASK